MNNTNEHIHHGLVIDSIIDGWNGVSNYTTDVDAYRTYSNSFVRVDISARNYPFYCYCPEGNILLRDVWVEGNTETSIPGFYIYGSRGVVFDRTTALSIKGAGYRVEEALALWMNNTMSDYCDEEGYLFDRVFDAYIENAVSSINDYNGFVFGQCGDFMLNNCLAKGNGKHGFLFDMKYDGSGTDQGCRHFTLTNCHSLENSSAAYNTYDGFNLGLNNPGGTPTGNRHMRFVACQAYDDNASARQRWGINEPVGMGNALNGIVGGYYHPNETGAINMSGQFAGSEIGHNYEG